jgi:mannose-6-phosphate isomerase-like protein (cupin superfamily)
VRKAILAVILAVGMFAGFVLAGQVGNTKHEPMMRGGSVRLKPGESVGWHSTNGNEEAIVILHGKGTANIEGHADVPLHEKILAYIPPATRHNVTNTGTEILEYVWVVAPTK